jgi:2-phospho-L-lactate guanylyltransferase
MPFNLNSNNVIAILPIRITQQSKNRLASVFEIETRLELAHVMLKDVLQAIRDSRYISQTILVCSDYETHSRLQSFEPEIFFTPKQGLNEELALAANHAITLEPDALIYILADLPLLTGLTINQIIQTGLEKASSVIASDWHGTGTNVLFIQPPNAFKPQFGSKSFERHLHMAHSLNHPIVCITFPNLEPNLDIDDWESIQIFLKKVQELEGAQKTYTYRFLKRILSNKKE